MRAGDILRLDFGVPARGEPGDIRPAVVVTADEILAFRQHAITVVPCTTTRRGWLSEIDLDDALEDALGHHGVAQAHLPTTISIDRLVESTGVNVGPVALAQIRQVIADLLDL